MNIFQGRRNETPGDTLAKDLTEKAGTDAIAAISESEPAGECKTIEQAAKNKTFCKGFALFMVKYMEKNKKTDANIIDQHLERRYWEEKVALWLSATADHPVPYNGADSFSVQKIKAMLNDQEAIKEAEDFLGKVLRKAYGTDTRISTDDSIFRDTLTGDSNISLKRFAVQFNTEVNKGLTELNDEMYAKCRVDETGQYVVYDNDKETTLKDIKEERRKEKEKQKKEQETKE